MEPIYTDYNKECELLKEWLYYWINCPAKRNAIIVDGLVVPYYSPEHLLDMLKTYGILMCDVTGMTQTRPMEFEEWKIYYNK